MLVNSKRPLTFKNPTKYFNPLKDKTLVTVSSPSSWQNKCAKTDGYEARLYWHYKYCTEKVNGQVFYYTLTYNDLSIPNYFGMNCFDYEDLRDLLTGGFRKKLLRKYGTIFKYFVGAELGDGKGSRGMHNNPHYHVLFFLEPDPDCKFPYVKISPEDFRTLVKEYWQGFDENKTGYKDYRLAKYGIAREGDNCGLVDRFDACVYCAKYVTKDVALICHEDKVRSSLALKFKDSIKTNEFYKDFYHTVIYDKFNTPLNPQRTSWSLNDDELYKAHFDRFAWALEWYGSIVCLRDIYSELCKDFIRKYHLFAEYREFYRTRLNELIDAGVTEYRNRYCNKCRISHGVGDYALEHLKDSDDPRIPVPSKDGIKYRPLSLYYYRKLFTDVITPIAPRCKVGQKPARLSPIRILNEDGLKYRLRRLDNNLIKKSSQSLEYLRLIMNDEELYNKMYLSDVNVDCNLTFSYFKSLVSGLNDDNFTQICNDYAIYKLVYEGRYFDPDSLSVDVFTSTYKPDYRCDYERFIYPSFHSVDRSDIRLDFFLEDSNKGALPYCEFPYFRGFIGIFNVLDLCSDYFFVSKDDKLEAEAKERQCVKRFHDSSRLKEYYSNFK